LKEEEQNEEAAREFARHVRYYKNQDGANGHR
jgi:hypothetical protein